MVSAIVLTLLLTSMLTLAFNLQPVRATGTVYIRADGSIDPPTAPISTVDNVTYILTGNITSGADGIVIERNSIIFDGAGYTIIGTGYDYSGISLSGRSNVTIKNTRITTFWWGIHLNSSSGNSISGNNITANSQYGIELYNSSNNSISGNNIADNFYGIRASSSSNNNMAGNNITANNHYGILLGIYLSSSNNNSIDGNAFVGCGLVVDDSYGSVVADNLVNGKHLVYLEGKSDFVVEDAGQVVLVNCTRIGVENLSLSNTTAGVQLWGTSNTAISGNNIADNFYGIQLDFSSNNSISGNDITNNDDGIRLSYFADNNSISGNNIADNFYGIQLFFSDNSSISGNDMANNFYGIRISYSSDNNSISGNNITNDAFGTGISSSSSFDNSIYHNNFDNAPQQVYSDGSTNVWDDGYPSCGNYWRNYKGTDLFGGPYQNETGSDGIGDTPYVTDENNTDHYPLMGMFSDFNATSEHHVQTVCNSSISGFQYNGTALSFNVSGEHDTAGFCRICIPTTLMNVTYEVFVNGTEVSYNLLPCSNETYSYLYFNYTHSTQEVIIIPEFPTFLILPLFFMATLSAVIVYRRKYCQID
jgi:parallel beta-helix repeat protein